LAAFWRADHGLTSCERIRAEHGEP
jgi:hypothetical protein